MKQAISPCRRALLISLLAMGLAGCGGVPFAYRPHAEIPDGPGLLSGAKGGVIFRSGESQEAKQSGDASSADSTGGSQMPDSTAVPAERLEFQDFQAFRRWRQSQQDSPEYREFQEWREWKDYRARKEQSK